MTSRKIKALKKAVEENQIAEDIFYPTKRDFLYWFTFINSAVFSSCLKVPDKIIFARLRGCYGDASGDIETGETLVRLRKRFTSEKIRSITASSRQMFIATVAHEMVHLLEFQLRQDMKHGKIFHEWKRKFSEIGIIL